MTVDSSSSAYGRPKTPKSLAASLGNGVPGTAKVVEEPVSTISGGKEVAVYGAYPPGQGTGMADAAGPGGGFAYSTTLRRTSSNDYIPGRARSKSPVAYRGGEYDAYGRGRSASIRQAVPEESEQGVLGRVADGLRRAVGGGPSEYQRITPDNDVSDRQGAGGPNKETPSAVYAHKSIDVSGPSLALSIAIAARA